MNIPNKKKLKLDAVRLWCLTTGYKEINNETENADLSFIKNGYRTNFITEFDKTSEELLMAVSNSKSNYIYIVTDDNAKRHELIKVLPEYCGIFCNSNPFGLGMLTQILREPQFLGTMRKIRTTKNRNF